jgi:hypothetical protein
MIISKMKKREKKLSYVYSILTIEGGIIIGGVTTSTTTTTTHRR